MVGIVNCHDDDDEQMGRWQEIMVERVSGRSMKAARGSDVSRDFLCDAAILLRNESIGEGNKRKSSCIKRALLPGGLMILLV